MTKTTGAPAGWPAPPTRRPNASLPLPSPTTCRVEPDTLAPRLAATSAVTGLRELYDSREARSLGPEPTGADLIQLVNQVIDYAIAGLAAVTAGH